MRRKWKVVLFLVVVLLLAMGASQAWSAPQASPEFTARDRELIAGHYTHIAGTLAPASIDRTPFPLGVEESLKPGARVPLQLEKQLVRLPPKLESELTSISGDYGRYILGHHVILVKRTDMIIVDIIKNVAVK